MAVQGFDGNAAYCVPSYTSTSRYGSQIMLAIPMLFFMNCQFGPVWPYFGLETEM
jgi:hypothetical protein